MAILRQNNCITKCWRTLFGKIISQQVTHYQNWRLKWWLTTRVFHLDIISGVGIVACRAKIFGKKVGASFAAPTDSKNQKKHPKSSRGKNFAVLGNGQRRLIE